MKRRDLIKTGIIAGAALGLYGCSNEKSEENTSYINSIRPKQTTKYTIITPLPFDFKLIEEMAEINRTYKKLKIDRLYNNFPEPLSNCFNNNFQSTRGYNDRIKSTEDYLKYVKFAKEVGFNNVYIFNSPRAITEKEFNKYKNKLFQTIDALLKVGCNNFKVANTQLLSILSEKYKNDIVLSASTSFEYHNISQYKNLLKTYPLIKSINISTDDNRNFQFLQSLRKSFPKVDLEIMVNETCIHGCPGRISHPQTNFYFWNCHQVLQELGHIKYLLRTNIVYPWDLEYYSAIGINSFKLVSRPIRANITELIFLRSYIDCIEYGYENYTVKDFFDKIFDLAFGNHNYSNNMELKLSEFKKYLPNIEYFVNNGHKCANICGIDCEYCYKCIDKVEKLIT